MHWTKAALASEVLTVNCLFFRLLKIKEWIDANDPGSPIIPFSGALETKLLDFETDEERKTYLETVKTTG